MMNFRGEENRKVSVVIPVYNQEKYLDASVSSVLGQSYSNLEIIAVNDGSADSSAEILEKFAKSDERIKIITKENGGLVDATIAGIDNISGDLVCFLDPDDNIGKDFVLNFISEMDDCDFVAAGFYREDNGRLYPYFLKEDRIYAKEDIRYYRSAFLSEKGEGTQNRFFISRWNKMYRSDCVKKAAESFRKCKGVSLGEDTIFTYLVLLNSTKCKTLRSVNSYFYNVGNQGSMMKAGKAEEHLSKSVYAFEVFKKMLEENKDDTSQAYALYYFLTETLFQRALGSGKDFSKLYDRLRKDENYKMAASLMKDRLSGQKRAELFLRKYISFGGAYAALSTGMKTLKKSGGQAKRRLQSGKTFVKEIKKLGAARAYRNMKFRKDRRNAFKDIRAKLPIIEERVTPFLKEYLGKVTDLEACTIERNVFVFWWDGFENAPQTVKGCLKSVIRNHPGYRVFEITKYNFEKYTTVNPKILADFKAGKISVQTFSDIMRFNLLKNNGGVWIDATIFFVKEYSLTDKLTDKSFESVCFSTSRNFLQYKNESCSWSGYFIASRKNGLFVTAVDEIFERYYLKYHTYSIYFFIDAVLMICKLNKLDGDVLSKVHFNNNDMTLLAKMLDEPYDKSCMEQLSLIPQKLNWKYRGGDNGSFYTELME